MISIRGVSFSYNGSDVPALKNIDLKIERGEFVLLTGESGSGKSSLCRVINGLIPHFHGGVISGHIEVAGLNPLQSSPGLMANRVGMVFQDPDNQLVTSDVCHEICFGMENLAFSRDMIAGRLDESLEMLDIKHLRNRPVAQLSGGEKQRTAIASVLALRPDILLLDEPTSQLDPAGSQRLLASLRRLNRNLGLTVILVEHRLEKAIHYADRLVVMGKGTVLVNQTPRSAMKKSDYALEECAISLPPVVELYRNLVARGVKLDAVPLSLEEGLTVFKKILAAPLPDPPEEVGRNNNAVAIEMEGVSFCYQNQQTILENINLTIKQGEVVAIMGQNASGKTTLLKLINGLLKPSSGSIKILGTDTSGLSVAELAATIGVVFQNPGDHLFSDTVEEEIAFGLKIRGVAPRDIEAMVGSILSRFNLEPFRARSPNELSLGEKQRLAIASIMVYEPPVLLLDEPCRGADKSTRENLITILRDHVFRGGTVVMVTHDVELVAEYSQRVVIMDSGRIIADGEKREVLPSAGSFSPQINQLVKLSMGPGASSRLLTAREVAGVINES
ncbi:MAG: energy-coupling factor transporter ATPase [Dehalococcoidales bacterium]|nr:energy-coupling factor transporter ATPase [Dehalococcoidales bacterium]MDD3264759.1 energy-coupling factor transporter ATPase [Dehalococcoidales bacterium]MDD4322498.1 energy-coupling factor transporter ATPase [Dehalococcoidales bacterium]